MKIAHIYQESNIQFHLPQAAQVHIYHTMRGLQQAGHEVSLLALQGRRVLCTQDLEVFRQEQLPASQYVRLGISGSTLFKGIESGIRRVQSELRLPYLAIFDSYRTADAAGVALQGFHLIHERYNLLSLGGTLASKKLGIPYILEVNADLLRQRALKGLPERGLRRLLAARSMQWSLDAADRIICVSASLRDHLEENWRIPSTKLSVLHCAADVDAFQPGRAARDVRRNLGLSDEPVVVWVGGFFPWHDLEMLVESFSRVLERRPDARMVLVGEGETRKSIVQVVQDRGIEHAVIMTGSVPHSEVPELLAIADVAVVPSSPASADLGGTGTPLKLFEYMSAGKAVVITASDQASEVIEDGRTGLVVNAGDSEGFAAAILSLLEHPEQRHRLGHNARKRIEEKYSWDHYTKKLEGIYESVLRKRPAISPASALS